MILKQGHIGKVKNIGRNRAKFVSVPYLSYEETIEVLISHTIAYDLRMFHDLNQRSLCKVTVNGRKGA